MKLYETNSKTGERLVQKANELRLPLGGTIELTSMCNMNCKMCYIHDTDQKMNSKCTLLSAEQWIQILQEAKENGVLYLLITGGEPLVYPEFKTLYKQIIKMGFLVTINTNATLMNEEWADFFAKYPCTGFNISLYGKDDATYHKVCGNSKGFTQVINALNLLKQRNLKFILTTSIVKDNMHQLEELYAIAQKYDVTYKPETYMFPAVRRNINAAKQYRLSAKDAAKQMIAFYKLKYDPIEFKKFAEEQLLRLFLPPRLTVAKGKKGYPCRGGKSGFWIDWHGNMTSCAMLEDPSLNLLEHSFSECWNHIVTNTRNTAYCDKCLHCHMQNICHVCPAITYTETGKMNGHSEYVCEYTEEIIRCLLEYIPYEERSTYYDALKNGGLTSVI